MYALETHRRLFQNSLSHGERRTYELERPYKGLDHIIVSRATGHLGDVSTAVWRTTGDAPPLKLWDGELLSFEKALARLGYQVI